MNSAKNFYIMLRKLKMDISRYTGQSWNPLLVIYYMFFKHPGIQFSIYYRFERYLLYESNYLFRLIGVLLYPLYFIATYYILDYNIHPKVPIGGGLFLHNKGIVFAEEVTVGKYFSCMGQVTIGRNLNKPLSKIIIGDNVFMGVGSKVIAADVLEIKSGVQVGANAVVTKSLNRENGVYIGIPAMFVKKK